MSRCNQSDKLYNSKGNNHKLIGTMMPMAFISQPKALASIAISVRKTPNSMWVSTTAQRQVG
jgi:hypothetical protein